LIINLILFPLQINNKPWRVFVGLKVEENKIMNPLIGYVLAGGMRFGIIFFSLNKSHMPSADNQLMASVRKIVSIFHSRRWDFSTASHWKPSQPRTEEKRFWAMASNVLAGCYLPDTRD